MRIEDLKDPRDRDHCQRAQKAVSVHDLRKTDQFRGRAGFMDTPTPNFDKRADEEFNAGVPNVGLQTFEMHDEENFPVVERRGKHEPVP